MFLTPITSVFHPTDFTHGNDSAFAHALRIALAAKCDLSLLHVQEDHADAAWDDFPSIRETLSQWGVLPADATHEDVTRLGVRVTKGQKVNPDPAEAIGKYVTEHLPDLVVLSTHQRQGLARLLKPALAEQIARLARVRTLFVPRRVAGFVTTELGEVRLRRILVPIDHDPRPQAAVAAAASLANTLGVSAVHFTCLFVGRDAERPSVQLLERENWTSEILCEQGDVVETILEMSDDRDVDLIVMSTHGHNGFVDALRGSTTERVLRGAKCPVLAVPAT